MGKPLSDVNFPRGAMIITVAWERGVYVPDGSDIIRPGNTVVVFTTPEVRPAVEHMFRKFSIRYLPDQESRPGERHGLNRLPSSINKRTIMAQ